MGKTLFNARRHRKGLYSEAEHWYGIAMNSALRSGDDGMFVNVARNRSRMLVRRHLPVEAGETLARAASVVSETSIKVRLLDDHYRGS